MLKTICKRWLSLSAVVLVLFGTMAGAVYARSGFFTPYSNYEYNYYKESVSAPVSYVLDKVYDASNMNLETALSGANDMAFNGSSMFILDSNNNRIIETDVNLKAKKIYTNFVMPAAFSASGVDETITIEGAEGFYVYDNGDFLIADTANERIIKIHEGRVVQVITQPDSPSIDKESPFYVRKVVVGSQGRIYALVESINQGALVFNEDGEFLSFYGSNKVRKTGEVIYKYLWRKFMSEEQLQQMYTFTPVNMLNFDIDARGFMISVTQDTSDVGVPNTVRRLNYENNDVLNSNKDHVFGDLEWDRDRKKVNATALVDVDVDFEGFYVLLDATRGRVFVYADDGSFVSEFGLYGAQAGTFGNPVALETIGEKIYVMDAQKNCIHVFSPTEYAKKYRAALLSLESGDLDQSVDAWQELLNENTNNELVYYGLGRVYDEAKEYETAMEYFKLAKDQESYSYSFKEYRKNMIQDNFLPMFIVVLVLVAICLVAVRLVKKKLAGREDSAYSVMESKWLFPLYTLFHPADGFIQFKTRKHIRSWEMTTGFIVAWFLLSVLKFFATGFIFNDKRTQDFSLFITAAASIGLYFLFVIANWAICTLIEGKGTLPEIMTMTSYALLPYLVSSLLVTICSNFFCLDEGSFMTIITYIGLVWTGLILFVGLMTIHEYSAGKTVVCILLTVFGMAVILFLIILFYTLITQTVSFAISVVQEVSLRL
ncbi:MAG: YIP1 family protein [Clostridia bacterium]|nr:YIP1 family protein [Clostridia bacterium]